ncbi:MAG: pyruvate dehydrogenase complex E1 component subunit beta [Holosporales bacterium]|jgi:pyruvate dehydrogenase E1 component beta subunit|nr:pyruvate dehydrogenase complex E1 component subunit beta [Holosporales bacterium]
MFDGGYNPMKKVPVRIALRDAMAEEMRNDPNVFLMGEEVARYDGAYKVSQGLLAEFGEERVIDTPISECGFAGIGVGAAFSGLRPIVEFMTFNFAMQAIDHIINSAAKILYMSGGQINCPIVFRGPNSAPGKVAAQHSQCFASWYAHCPGLKVVSPYTSFEAKALLKSAIQDDNPVVFLEHEVLYGKQFDIPDEEISPIPLDKAIIMREGEDITIVAFSISVDYALEAAEILQEKYGISAEVINLISLRPIDQETIIKSVKKTGRIINVEEGWLSCGIGAEIVSIIIEKAFDYLDAPPIRISAADVPMPYAQNLEQLALPNAMKVVEQAKMIISK